MTPTTTDGKIWIEAPDSYYPKHNYCTGVLGMWIEPDEEVEWTWSYGPDGSRFVTGYTIRKKLNTKVDWE